MKRVSPALVSVLLTLVGCAVVPADMARAQKAQDGAMAAMKHDGEVRSTTLTVTGLDGTVKTLSLADLRGMPQTNATVMNGHTHAQETYGGVAVKDLLALVAPAKMVPVAGADAMKAKVSTRMMVVVARGTDGFRVALTVCDTDPGCRSGQAMVADTVDGKPLGGDGAFKLILTEDKTPGRWVRNLEALTVKGVGGM